MGTHLLSQPFIKTGPSPTPNAIKSPVKRLFTRVFDTEKTVVSVCPVLEAIILLNAHQTWCVCMHVSAKLDVVEACGCVRT